MASAILYPPIVDGYIPAVATGEKIFIPFSFSKFNATDADGLINGDYPDFDKLTVQAAIYEVTSGQSMVNTTYTYNDGEGFDPGYTANANAVYAGSGTIINLTPVKEKDTYQIQLVNKLFKGNKPTECKMYKIQLRFSGKTYDGKDGENDIAQADWLNKNASFFSEWSTVCILKYTYIPQIQFKNPISEIINDIENNEITHSIKYNTENLLFYGNYYNQDESEYLTSYRIQLYNSNYDLIEDSKNIDVNDYSQTRAGSFNHELKTELLNKTSYIAYFSYTTNNYFSDSIEIAIETEFDSSVCDLEIDTIDFNNSKQLDQFTSIGIEEDDARVALFVMTKDNAAFPLGQQYRIKRYSSNDGFKRSEVVTTFMTSEDNWHGVLGPFYDWDIESGVIYKYGIQKMTDINKHIYTSTNKTGMLTRNYDFSFLLGRDSKQLKLMFNQQLNNFSITVNDSQVTTIGGRYPFITRNGDTRFKTFPVSGLISFNMDENELFVSYEDLFPDKEVRDYYKAYNINHRINMGNNVVYEKAFREKVLDFLYDDKPKLFKSPTEGNILIRIMNVSCSPNSTLNRMIYDFSGTAYEIAENTVENCEKYKLIDTTYGVVSKDMQHEIKGA